MRDDLDAERIKGQQAKDLLRDEVFKEAIENVRSYLENQALGCDPDNERRAQRIMLSKQLLESIIREITNIAENGTMAEVQIDQLRESKVQKMFKR